MSKRLAKDKHDRTALDVIYDLEDKKYKMVTIRYSLENDSSYIHSMEDISESVAVAIMQLNIANDKKIQGAIKFAKEKVKSLVEEKNKDEEI